MSEPGTPWNPLEPPGPLTNLQRRIDAHADDRTRGQFDVLALGGRDDTATADDRAEDRALQPADDSPDDGADGAGGADRTAFFTNAAALEDLSGHAAKFVFTSVDRDAV